MNLFEECNANILTEMNTTWENSPETQFVSAKKELFIKYETKTQTLNKTKI